MVRVPKMIVNTAMPPAIQKAVPKSGSANGAVWSGPKPLPTTWKLMVSALSC
jgi:hypothetical protein